MQTFNLIAYNNATFRWTLDVSPLSDFFAAGGALHMKGTFPSGTSYEWIQGAASGGIINVSSAAGVYTALFTAPLKDTSLWFGKMTFDCRGELPGGAAIPIMSGAIDFRQGKTRLPDDATSTSISTIYDTVDGSGPALVLPVDWTATLNAARGYASDAAASAASAAVAASMAAAAASGSVATFRNRLINGNFDIWQRGASIALPTFTALYGPDRFTVANGTIGAATISKIAAPVGFRAANAAQCAATGVTAGQYIDFIHRFEARQVCDLDGVASVLSFDLSASTTAGALSGSIYLLGNSAVDNGSWSVGMLGYGQSFSVSSVAGNVIIPIPAANMVGAKNGFALFIRFVQNTSTGNPTITLGSVQFEPDRQVAGAWGNPTPFEFRPLSVELAMCHRYYATSYEDGTTAGTATTVGANEHTCGSTNNWEGLTVAFPVKMRASPTMTIYSPNTGASGKIYGTADVPAALDSISSKSAHVVVANTSVVAGTALGFHWTASAEL